jgi:hypothetical protein
MFGSIRTAIANPAIGLLIAAKKLSSSSKLDVETAREAFELISKCVLRDKNIRHYMPSVIYSKEDLRPSRLLIETCADAVKRAWGTELTCGRKGLRDSEFLNVFPGEHYRLINSIINVTGASQIVEIGTYTGMGTLAMRDGLAGNGVVTTFDIVAWDKLGVPSHFTADDFTDGRVRQVIGNLAADDVFEQYADLLNGADIIFLDAPKDDVFEYKMVSQFQKLKKKDGKLLIIDDICFVNMIDFWRGIASPKIDMSSFGHWSGTGLVDISQGMEFRAKGWKP